MREPVLRRGGRDDDEGIRALLAANFPGNPKRLEAFTRWQYWENPFGEVRSWLFEADGRVVAHWAAVPVPMRLDGRAVLGAKGVDGATDPAYRGRGFFRSVGEAMRRDCGAHGIPMIFSHPNPKAARGVAQAGGELVARVPVQVLPLDDAWLAGRFHLPRTLVRSGRALAFRTRPGAAGDRVDGPPGGLDALWDEAGRGVRNGIVRDAAWWAWRYGDRPTEPDGEPYRFYAVRRDGRLRGAAVVALREAFGGRFAFVLELLAADDDAARGLVAALAGDLVEGGAAAGAALAALPATLIARHARRAGFRRLPRALEPHPFRFMVIDCAEVGGLAQRDWTMAWGDLDHL